MAWPLIQEKDVPLDSRVDEKSKEKMDLIVVLHLFAHQPWSSQESSLVSLRATKMLTRNKETASPAKMGLFRISWELQFRVCNPSEPRASPPTARKRQSVRKEKEAGSTTVIRVHGFSLAELFPRKKRSLLVVGLCCHHRTISHCIIFFFFLWLHLQHMAVSRLGVKSELQLPVYATATVDPSCI